FIESGANIANNVTIKNLVTIWEGVTIENDVFVGPNVVFTNDLRPRSPRNECVKKRYEDKNWCLKTIVKEGASIGANSTIVAGIELGSYCMIGAGSVVVKNVRPFTLVFGNPARERGNICRCGNKIIFTGFEAICSECGSVYMKINDVINLKK
ncbi:MAG: N-acetyltransferase, partial [Oligoflexia bacterium]|nr:N-acetyltransferase [Oligoflexia bacterium]